MPDVGFVAAPRMIRISLLERKNENLRAVPTFRGTGLKRGSQSTEAESESDQRSGKELHRSRR